LSSLQPGANARLRVLFDGSPPGMRVLIRMVARCRCASRSATKPRIARGGEMAGGIAHGFNNRPTPVLP
jgi:hypothetical protein